MPVFLLGIVLSALGAQALADGLHPVVPVAAQPEQVLLLALDNFRRGNVQPAIDSLQNLVRDEPNYRLAHLVYGDLLASRAGVPLSVDAQSRVPRAYVDGLIAEARQRWRGKSFHPNGRVPESLMRFSSEQHHALLVDPALSRLYVFENADGQPELIADYYVSAGKNGTRKLREGDQRTPLGVYFIVERLPGEELPDKYGPIAFPVNYPNLWDERHGRTGSGIWLHGVSSDTYSRPPLDSDGCVAMTNDELLSIAPLLEVGNTPVIIVENASWIAPHDLVSRRTEMDEALETWRRDWQSGDSDRYLAHYAPEFKGRGMNKPEWGDYKRTVNESKQFIEVGVSDVSMFSYPDEEDLVVVTFKQDYQSDSFRSRADKRQYWRRASGGRWLIVAEEAI